MIEASPKPSRLCGVEPGRRIESPARDQATSRACGVLLVDDQACVREMLGIGLQQEGFAVWLAANGWEAFELYRCRRAVIDVVVLDMHMPALNGSQSLVALQLLNPRICCCFLSGDLDRHTEDRLRSMGAAAVFHKPIGLQELAHALRQLTKVDLTSSSL